ncbi:MAG TPA: hypothetical protein EYP49_10815 [Anaerolineae bacterium]|nr:hypothetical protein [Anaerolineae bacterium]
MQTSNRVLIIGLDGADWRVLRPYLNDGIMPNLAHMIETGVSGTLRSTIPTHSAVAWASFMTGRNPGKHAVYDFMQRAPGDPTRMVGANSRSLRSETFFDVLAKHGRQIGAINVPMTYPPFPVHGFMLGGMSVHEGKPYTFPESLVGELEDRVGGFPVNRIRWRYTLGRWEELLDEAIEVTKQRAHVLKYLIDYKDWDVLIQVFVSPDRLQHPLMHILDSEHPFYDDALAQRLKPKLCVYFKLMDDILGRSQQQVGKDAALMVISDHGFRSVHKSIRIPEILGKHGLLKTRPRAAAIRLSRKRLLRPVARWIRTAFPAVFPASNRNVGSPMQMTGLVWPQTQAYVTTNTSQGIYVNLKGREPQGIVTPGDAYEHLLDNIQEILLAERDPANGQPLIESVMRGKDSYVGPWVELAPDVLFVPSPGYMPAREAHLQSLRWQRGDHDLDGIFVTAGPGIKCGGKIDGAALVDVAPTVLYLTGAPIPEDMDGQVLDIFADQRLTSIPPKYEKSRPADYEAAEYTYTQEEELQIEEQLRSLGYF